jgi:hypothetical protein
VQEDYSHFLVLTQTCDLVRRNGGKCRSRYITLAPVRPLDIVISREIERHQKDLDALAAACSRSKRETIRQFVMRLLNNNEPDYFYLHPDVGLGLLEAGCAFLRLAIGLRAYQHYDLCREARVLSLTEVFRAKLGWLAGNTYSRVATEDWTPTHKTKEEFGVMVDALLDQDWQWFDDAQMKAARRSATGEVLNGTREGAREHIKQTVVPRRRDVILDCVAAALRQSKLLDEKSIKRVRHRIANDPTFANMTK